MQHFSDTEVASTIRGISERWLNPGKGACYLAERIRETVSAGTVDGCPDAVTLSAGASTYPETTGTHDMLIKDADNALYEAKHGGRNRVSARTADKASEGKMAPLRDLQSRVDIVEIEISLLQAHSRNYSVLMKNESDEEVSLIRITLERSGIRLTEPARPAQSVDWKLSPKSGKQIEWKPQPDPVSRLLSMESNRSMQFHTDMEIVVLCEIPGKLREFRRKILVDVDIKNCEMRQLSG